jgi:glycosyltransferase involved in cell wall biosynthesis
MVVHHFGPDPTTVGGIASVIRVLSKHRIGADEVDCIPTWMPDSGPRSLRLAAEATRKLLGTPSCHIAHVHLSERGSFVREGAIVALARHRGLRTVATIHGADFAPFACTHRSLVSRVLGHADLITCLDQEALDIAQRSAPTVRCELLANPAEPDEIFMPADTTDELVLFAGEIGLRKGADVLWRTWQLVASRRPDAQCLMVGPVHDYLPPDAERLELLSPVDHSQMRELLRRARAIALPSRAEGMPMILIEAMSLGRPFVSTPVGGIPELARAGGLLVPVEDEIALADRLTELLAEPDLARMIGERGRKFCIETHGIDVIDARLRTFYSELTHKRRSRD